MYIAEEINGSQGSFCPQLVCALEASLQLILYDPKLIKVLFLPSITAQSSTETTRIEKMIS